ncbi:MAG: prolipoprotein diacylglyceryl transferase [Patescibacteria group bacterium]|nr:prolipoprotein diacylglyceryl transferase [Patescibacteria group bacterium]
MLDFWQHLPYKIDPVIVELGIFSARWYWLMYVAGFSAVYFLLSYRLRRGEREVLKKTDKKSEAAALDALWWMFLGLIMGARLGYFIFYDWAELLKDPLILINPLANTGQGWVIRGWYGMSYHGGLIGAAAALFLYCAKNKLNFLRMADFILPAVPLGFFFGRVGNFLNGELYGRVTGGWWGMYFPLAYYSDGISLLRHASQLYEAFFEGLLLFLILWLLRNYKSKQRPGFITGLYLIFYGFFRFFIEFAREPDEQLGLLFWGFSMGQALCFLMLVIGFIFAIMSFRSDRFTKEIL